MAEGNDLGLLPGTGSKRRSDQSQKGDEKWTHRGDDDDLAFRAPLTLWIPKTPSGLKMQLFSVRGGRVVVAAVAAERGPPLHLVR